MQEKRSVNISKKLHDLISARINDSNEFQSVDDYVEFVLKELLEEENNDQKSVSKDEYEISEEEQKRIKEELKKLGYI